MSHLIQGFGCLQTPCTREQLADQTMLLQKRMQSRHKRARARTLRLLPAPRARRSPLSSAPSDARRFATAPAKRHSPPHAEISSL